MLKNDDKLQQTFCSYIKNYKTYELRQFIKKHEKWALNNINAIYCCGTASSLAVCNRNEEGLQILLEHKANPNEYAGFGQTLLDTAIKTKYYDTAKLLLQYGVSSNIRENALYTAIVYSWIDGVKLLLEHKTDINRRFRDSTYLCIASSLFCSKTVSLLLEAKANIEEEDDNGLTPLMNTIYANRLSNAEFLIYSGCSVEYQIEPLISKSIVKDNNTIKYLRDRKQVLIDHNLYIKNKNTRGRESWKILLKIIMPLLMPYKDLVNYILDFNTIPYVKE